jgi:hypothetical protein
MEAVGGREGGRESRASINSTEVLGRVVRLLRYGVWRGRPKPWIRCSFVPPRASSAAKVAVSPRPWEKHNARVYHRYPFSWRRTIRSRSQSAPSIYSRTNQSIRGLNVTLTIGPPLCNTGGEDSSTGLKMKRCCISVGVAGEERWENRSDYPPRLIVDFVNNGIFLFRFRLSPLHLRM